MSPTSGMPRSAQVTGPGDLLRIVGDFLGENVTTDGKVLLQPLGHDEQAEALAGSVTEDRGLRW